MAGRLAHLGSMLRLVARGLTARGDLEPLPEVPKRKPSVEADNLVVEPGFGRRMLPGSPG